MGDVVHLDQWVLRKRVDSAIFEWEWEFKEMGDDNQKQPVQIALAREVADVCNVFREVTGLTPDPKKEKTVILYWHQRGWSLRDFRLMIEQQFSDPRQKAFYGQPGNLTLRMMLNPASADRLTDILEQIRYSERIQVQQKALKVVNTRPLMLMRCGVKIPLGDKISYDSHMSECFERKGACFL